MPHSRSFFLSFFIFALALRPAGAGIVEEVRGDLAQNSFSSAEAALNSYRGSNGITPEYIDAYSWLARAALSAQEYDQAAAYAKQTNSLAQQELKKRALDAEPHLPLALGAAIEVQSQVLVARGQRTQAIAVLQSALRTYGNTSIHERLQKNLNLLSFEGRLAPPLRPGEQFLGSKPQTLASMKGSPVLLFFWAHWCGDCKAEAPIITQLRTEYAPKGLQVIGPTRLYGYTAREEHASQSDELAFIDAVR
ncbi:MAG TPA: redoxin domain-containing protein, partial [Candidatus Binatia bacterium]|nr:redoxin domain-containing protein [Candidatus Binatia bacterium]